MHSTDSADKRIKDLNKSFEQLDKNIKKVFPDDNKKVSVIWYLIFFVSSAVLLLCVYILFDNIMPFVMMLVGLSVIYSVKNISFGIVITGLSLIITALGVFRTGNIIVSEMSILKYILCSALIIVALISVIFSAHKINY